jgi:hypothetical protein
MKTLSIPFLPDVKGLSPEEVALILDDFGTRFSIEYLNWPDQFSYKPITFVSAGHSKADLYLLFQVHGNCLRAVCTKDNQSVHEDSCVEFFVKAPEEDTYFNFEFNCTGVCKAARHFGNREDFVYLSPSEMLEIERWSSIGKRAFNEINGLFSWELAVKIPFRLMGINPEYLPFKLLGNFYKCADLTSQPHYVSWNPIETEKPDFHRPEYFGELLLV